MEITLTSAELADLLNEARRNGAHGAPDYNVQGLWLSRAHL